MQKDGSHGPPYERETSNVVEVEPYRALSPPSFILPQLAYYRADDHPGQVYHGSRRAWVPETDDAYIRWKKQGWAVETSHADEDALADHMRGLGGRGPHFVPPNARRRNFIARELFAVFTDEDVANIQIALDAETGQAKSDKAAGHAPRTPLRLLWASLQAQGDAPIDVSPRLRKTVSRCR
jgi:hypothetical protein